MRSAPIVPTTTCRCEGCGLRVAEEKLWYPTQAARLDHQMGCPFYFSYDRGGQIRIDRVLNTVCSQRCDTKVSAWKRPRVAKRVQEVRAHGLEPVPPSAPPLVRPPHERPPQVWSPREAAAALRIPLARLRRWLLHDTQGIRDYCVTKRGRWLVLDERRLRIWFAVWQAAQTRPRKKVQHG